VIQWQTGVENADPALDAVAALAELAAVAVLAELAAICDRRSVSLPSDLAAACEVDGSVCLAWAASTSSP
jgi:hypothetical protein